MTHKVTATEITFSVRPVIILFNFYMLILHHKTLHLQYRTLRNRPTIINGSVQQNGTATFQWGKRMGTTPSKVECECGQNMCGRGWRIGMIFNTVSLYL